MREGTNEKKFEFKPTDEMKLRAWEFMKKHALPRMIEEERGKEDEGNHTKGSWFREEKGRSAAINDPFH